MSYISGMDDPASLYWQSVSALSPLSNIVGLWIEKKKIPFWEKLVERYINNKRND